MGTDSDSKQGTSSKEATVLNERPTLNLNHCSYNNNNNNIV